MFKIVAIIAVVNLLMAGTPPEANSDEGLYRAQNISAEEQHIFNFEDSLIFNSNLLTLDLQSENKDNLEPNLDSREGRNRDTGAELRDKAIPSPIDTYWKPFNSIDRSFGFDPGHLISDEVFLNSNSMSTEGIQSFLDTIVPECFSSSIPCLKDFILDIPATEADERGICEAIAEDKGVSAAYIIKQIADACGINPQVILSHIEKEQGLVSSTSPTSYMYRAAMGYNCADSHNLCGTLDGGFWNQIYQGSKQKLWYGNPDSDFNYFKIGEENRIKYHPNEACGRETVIIKNRATASLYYYTPYVPNSAAIRSRSGLGDDCSSYGNRNFFNFFNEWFGNSRTEYKFIGMTR